jgi:hypothetical protein
MSGDREVRGTDTARQWRGRLDRGGPDTDRDGYI